MWKAAGAQPSSFTELTPRCLCCEQVQSCSSDVQSPEGNVLMWFVFIPHLRNLQRVCKMTWRLWVRALPSYNYSLHANYGCSLWHCRCICLSSLPLFRPELFNNWKVLLAAILLIFFPNQDKSEYVDSKWAALSAVTSRGHHNSSVVLDTEIMKAS